ncbi:class I SAM-dependent methyltransferase [Salipaludibacillus sp. HK11]|uniref:class I SAM-dependent methyltransferase n=1 Tax=Salipaludibacillus sp. HK11 TaxID=3394320 RepID=UPI0039FBB6AB
MKERSLGNEGNFMILEGIITTPGRPTIQVKTKAKQLAKQWKLRFEERNKRSVQSMMEQYKTTIFVVRSLRVEAHRIGEPHPFFFHPNAAMFRAKRWYYHEDDPFVSTCQIERGDIYVDATLGLASDAQLASMAVGEEGKVIGLEASPIIATLVHEGLASYESNFQPLNEAMRQIDVVNIEHTDWMRAEADDSVDIVYFDPMFEAEVKKSDGFQALREYSSRPTLTDEVINEAKRIAKKRIVLKDHFRSTRFESLGFKVLNRPSATYHFGVIELEKSENNGK